MQKWNPILTTLCIGMLITWVGIAATTFFNIGYIGIEPIAVIMAAMLFYGFTGTTVIYARKTCPSLFLWVCLSALPQIAYSINGLVESYNTTNLDLAPLGSSNLSIPDFIATTILIGLLLYGIPAMGAAFTSKRALYGVISALGVVALTSLVLMIVTIFFLVVYDGTPTTVLQRNGTPIHDEYGHVIGPETASQRASYLTAETANPILFLTLYAATAGSAGGLVGKELALIKTRIMNKQ